MSTHIICFYEAVDKSTWASCNLKTTKLLNFGLIEVCMLIRLKFLWRSKKSGYTIFTLNIGTPYLFTILVLKFQIAILLPVDMSLGHPTEIGLQLGKVCYPCSWYEGNVFLCPQLRRSWRGILLLGRLCVRASVRPCVRPLRFLMHSITSKPYMLGFWNFIYGFFMKK